VFRLMSEIPRRAAVLGAVATISLSFAACANEDTGSGGEAGDAVRVGVLLPYTGPFGLYGEPMEAALRARFAKVDNKVDGRRVELIFEDEATDAKTAVSKATKLIEQDDVDAVVCCPSGAATLAVGPIANQAKIPQIGPIPNPAGLAEFDTAAVAAPTAAHDAEMLGKHAATNLGYKRAAVIASDFAYGKEVAEGFAKGFTGAGGTVAKRTFAPLGTTDFGSYLSGTGGTDVTFAGFAGEDAIRFVQQYEKFGVKTPLIGHGPLVTELVLNAIGDPAIDVGAGFYYSSQLDNAANKEFIDTMKAASAEFVPSHFTAGAWATGSVLIDAIQRAGDDASDGEALAEAIRATQIDAPWGPLRFDQNTGYAQAPTYYYTVTKDGGKLRHDVKEEISGP
jgi:branched-chain amino acid transport system substrate-binding protein